jgi:hypothetical protein
MSSPPTVYLDTQDYSRFGDVLRGKSDSATESLFLALERRRQAGDAIFVLSMPVLGELLQYDADFRETTIRKAEAVERLCGSWALAFPPRLIAAEIAEAAKNRGLLEESQNIEVLSSDRYWYPNVAHAFGNLRAQMREAFATEVAALHLPSRALRRRAKREGKRIDLVQAAREAAPVMAAEYGLPVGAISDSLVALLSGTVTPEQASRRLFGAIAEPVKFVEMYFEKIDTDRTVLPKWISTSGTDFETRLNDLYRKVNPLLELDFARIRFDELLVDWPEKLGATALRMAEEDIAEFGLDSTLLGTLAADSSFVDDVPACEIVGKVITAYVRQALGLEGTEGKVERSFAGDLVHALYLPHVDLWRGDRRFSALVNRAVPHYSDRIVPTLKALPHAIDTWRGADAR